MHISRNVVMVGLMLACFGVPLLAQTPEVIPPAFENPAEEAGQTGENEDDSGQDAFDASAPKQVQVQVEFVEISHEALTKLLFMAKPGSANAGKLRQQVQDMVAKNEARVLETQIACARSGQKASAESISETIYPTEYTPPVLASAESGKNNTGVTIVHGNPTAFETRNVGSKLEIEPTIGADDVNIDIRFVPELVWNSGNTTWMEHKDEKGNVSKIETPNFYTLRLNTALVCKDGQYTFAGVLSPKDSKGGIDMTRKVMIFIKCDILTVR
jgi:Flp pilus assembly secretin CpaC